MTEDFSANSSLPPDLDIDEDWESWLSATLSHPSLESLSCRETFSDFRWKLEQFPDRPIIELSAEERIELEKKKPGRKRTTGSALIREIYTNSMKPLKVEYVRIQTIRFLKKCIRLLKKNDLKKLRTFAIDPQNETIIRKMIEIYRANQSELNSICNPANGPATDNPSLGTRSQRSAAFLTYSNRCCALLYQSFALRQLHYYAILLRYGEAGKTDPGQLCTSLKEHCCWNSAHTLRCVHAWSHLRRYLVWVMIEDMKLEPFSEEIRHEDELEELQQLREDWSTTAMDPMIEEVEAERLIEDLSRQK